MKKNFQKRFILTLILSFLISTTTVFGASFSDVKGHWAEKAIQKAMGSQWIKGYEDGRFQPNKEVSRGEFLTMVTRAFSLQRNEKPLSYDDVRPTDWFYPGVVGVTALGSEKFFPGPTFSPNLSITRQEVAGVLHLVMDSTTTLEDRELSFTDKNRISDLYQPAVGTLVEEGILAGYPDGSFQPEKSLTRSEATILILRILGEEKKVLPSNLLLEEVENKSILRHPTTKKQILFEDIGDEFIQVDGKKVVLDKDSTLKTGWVKKGEHTYYALGKQGLVRGWKEIEGKLYYFTPYDETMLKDGVFSTGYGVYWFGEDGGVKSGTRLGGHTKSPFTWSYPDAKELENHWLHVDNAQQRFKGQAIVNFAAKHEGIPFKWFGCDLRNPTGVYCCGSIYSAYKEYGVAIPGPNDVDMYQDGGYRMVKAQYEDAKAFGGTHVPMDVKSLYPGDILFQRKKGNPYGYNHESMFMGYNGKNPINIHATFQYGYVVNPVKLRDGWEWQQAVRYLP